MTLKRIIGSVTAAVALTAAVVLYTVHPVKSSDHQDTYNLATQVGHNASADITDVYAFPAPDNPNNVVLAMNVWPLIATGMGPSKFFDPTLMWQFKISHQASGVEDQVIQFRVSGTDANQRITMYGPAAPNEVGTTNTFVSTVSGSATYNKATQLANNTIQLYAGPRADPFVFDLFAFYSFLGDRNFASHTSQTDPGAGNTLPNINGNTFPPTNGLAKAYDQDPARAKAPSFNGFAPNTMSNTNAGGGAAYAPALGAYACSTNPATNTLASFNVLSFVVEVPKSLLENGFSSHTIHFWATSNSSTTTS